MHPAETAESLEKISDELRYLISGTPENRRDWLTRGSAAVRELAQVVRASSAPHAGFEVVTWVDSFGLEGGWQHVEDVSTQPVTIASVGLVLAEDADSLTLAAHVGYHGSERAQVGGALTIPKVAIVQRARVLTSSCLAFASGQSRQPTSPPSSTSDPEGSSTPSSQRTATCTRASVASS